MTAWETEDEYAAAGCTSLPSPTDTPRSNRSRSRQNRISTGPINSPPLKGYNRHSRSNDINISESISMLNPHRFTPTLHANLVAEILGLRRDQEEKKKIIESLEATLLETREEHESASAELSSTTQENNSLKRELDLLEGGTSSALSELAKERDTAIQSVTEIKGRLTLALKRTRSREEELDRSHVLWTREKSAWEEQKRKLERRVHVAEGRLKKVLEEVTEFETRQSKINSAKEDPVVEIHNSQFQSSKQGCGHRESTASTLRFSMSHLPPSALESKSGGLSLADELECSFEAESDNFVDWESVSSRDQSRPSSRNSSENDILSTSSTRTSPRPSSIRERTLIKRKEDRAFQTSPEKSRESVSLDSVEHSSAQISTEIEPPVAKLSSQVLTSLDEKDSQSPYQQTFEKNSENNSFPKNFYVTPPINTMISVASQTSGLLEIRTSSVAEDEKKTEMKTCSTQTDLPSPEATSLSVIIPSIQLHPPSPTPTLPEQVFPPEFKDAFCQVEIPLAAEVRSTSIQTEEIRIDKRIYSLPSHLQPSSISSNPPSPVADNAGNFPSSSENALKVLSKSPPPEKCSESNPIKRGSLGVQFFNESQNSNHKNSTLDDGEHADDDLSEPDYEAQIHASKHRKRRSFRQNSGPNDDSAQSTTNTTSLQTVIDEATKKSYFSVGSQDLKLGDSKNQSVIDLEDSTHHFHSNIQSELSYSSSLSEKTPEPPFPIPLRRSSRRVTPGSMSDDRNDSPTSGQGRRIHRRPGSMRKQRSNVLSKTSKNMTQKRDYRTTHSSISTIDQQSFTPPPIPEHEFSSRRKVYNKEHERYSPTPNSINQTVESASDSSTSVVSAIAQTMVGEWMFKYVRRRKSIGVPEASLDAESSNGVRHKRWVWLAPYERQVMWSTKQPTSGSALMGKSGRKLNIQSVLDVKDDNSPVKGVQLFNRSILILTPARALKFTATSMERHYIWLTALSFLAHSSQGIPESTSSPVVNFAPKLQPTFEASPSRRRQFGIRQDSILLAKSKLALASNPAINSVQSTSELPIENYYSMQSSNQAAYAPIVPRFTDRTTTHSALGNNSNTFIPLHQRRRSNTGSRYPSQLSIFADRSVSAFSPSMIKDKPYPSSATSTEMQIRKEAPYFLSHSSALNSRSALPSPIAIENDVLSWSNCDRLDSAGTGTVRMEAFVSSPDSFQEEFKDESNGGCKNNENLSETNQKKPWEVGREPSFF
ncbi:hypothetical protein K3495_g10115 [Podosphaera aphanis]|nr:hypothetical protein K3495_g10115 [Podosphaera aphanis]